MDEIRSWWEVPSIAHFCSLFRSAFDLADFDIEELEDGILASAGVEENYFLVDLISQLLKGCYGRKDISYLNYEGYLKDILTQRWEYEEKKENPLLNSDFKSISLREKVEILHSLCDYRLDALDVPDLLKGLESENMRVDPLGVDNQKSTYWYFYGTRLYKEDPEPEPPPTTEKKKKNNTNNKKKKTVKKRQNGRGKRTKRKRGKTSWTKQKQSSRQSESSDPETDVDTTCEQIENKEEITKPIRWHLICTTLEDWEELAEKFSKSKAKCERDLHKAIVQDFLPEIPILIQEKEKEMRRKLLETAPRRTSSRIQTKQLQRGSEDSNSSDFLVGDKEIDAATREHQKEVEKHEEEKRQKEEKEKAREERSRRMWLREERARYIIEGKEIPPELYDDRNKEEVKLEPPDAKTFSGMLKVIKAVKAHKNAWPFCEPVQEIFAPSYFEIIKHPMDLSTMEKKVRTKEYQSKPQFIGDFKQIVRNCHKYNGPENEYSEMADAVGRCFNNAVKKYLPKRASDHDEEFVGKSCVSGSLGSRPSRAASSKALEALHQAAADALRASSLSSSSSSEEDIEENEKNSSKPSFIIKMEPYAGTNHQMSNSQNHTGAYTGPGSHTSNGPDMNSGGVQRPSALEDSHNVNSQLGQQDGMGHWNSSLSRQHDPQGHNPSHRQHHPGMFRPELHQPTPLRPGTNIRHALPQQPAPRTSRVQIRPKPPAVSYSSPTGRPIKPNVEPGGKASGDPFSLLRKNIRELEQKDPGKGSGQICLPQQNGDHSDRSASNASPADSLSSSCSATNKDNNEGPIPPSVNVSGNDPSNYAVSSNLYPKHPSSGDKNTNQNANPSQPGPPNQEKTIDEDTSRDSFEKDDLSSENSDEDDLDGAQDLTGKINGHQGNAKPEPQNKDNPLFPDGKHMWKHNAAHFPTSLGQSAPGHPNPAYQPSSMSLRETQLYGPPGNVTVMPGGGFQDMRKSQTSSLPGQPPGLQPIKTEEHLDPKDQGQQGQNLINANNPEKKSPVEGSNDFAESSQGPIKIYPKPGGRDMKLISNTTQSSNLPHSTSGDPYRNVPGGMFDYRTSIMEQAKLMQRDDKKEGPVMDPYQGPAGVPVMPYNPQTKSMHKDGSKIREMPGMEPFQSTGGVPSMPYNLETKASHKGDPKKRESPGIPHYPETTAGIPMIPPYHHPKAKIMQRDDVSNQRKGSPSMDHYPPMSTAGGPPLIPPYDSIKHLHPNTEGGSIDQHPPISLPHKTKDNKIPIQSQPPKKRKLYEHAEQETPKTPPSKIWRPGVDPKGQLPPNPYGQVPMSHHLPLMPGLHPPPHLLPDQKLGIITSTGDRNATHSPSSNPTSTPSPKPPQGMISESGNAGGTDRASPHPGLNLAHLKQEPTKANPSSKAPSQLDSPNQLSGASQPSLSTSTHPTFVTVPGLGQPHLMGHPGMPHPMAMMGLQAQASPYYHQYMMQQRQAAEFEMQKHLQENSMLYQQQMMQGSLHGFPGYQQFSPQMAAAMAAQQKLMVPENTAQQRLLAHLAQTQANGMLHPQFPGAGRPPHQ